MRLFLQRLSQLIRDLNNGLASARPFHCCGPEPIGGLVGPDWLPELLPNGLLPLFPNELPLLPNELPLLLFPNGLLPLLLPKGLVFVVPPPVLPFTFPPPAPTAPMAFIWSSIGK